jgi:hypothetical protein
MICTWLSLWESLDLLCVTFQIPKYTKAGSEERDSALPSFMVLKGFKSILRAKSGVTLPKEN